MVVEVVNFADFWQLFQNIKYNTKTYRQYLQIFPGGKYTFYNSLLKIISTTFLFLTSSWHYKVNSNSTMVMTEERVLLFSSPFIQKKWMKPLKKLSPGKISRVYIEEWHSFLNYVFMIYIFKLQTKEGFFDGEGKKEGHGLFVGVIKKVRKLQSEN